MHLVKRFKYIIVLFLASPFILSVSFYFIVFFGVFGKIPSTQDLKGFQNEVASQIITSDKRLLGKIYSKNRTTIKYQSLPKHLLNALVATEDARFFEHTGVDSKSLLRVLVKSILLGDKSGGGGSTLSQQLAKNMFGRKSYGSLSMPINKTKEIILANRIEEIYTKEEIITQYFNTVPFGENIYGIESASKRFFNKETIDLSIQEAAVLVGMLKANSYYNPRLNPENALERRNVVMHQMTKYDYLSSANYDSLKKLDLKLDYANLEAEGPANYFLVDVKKQAKYIVNHYNDENNKNLSIEKDGLIIETTLNYQLQKYALNSFKEHLGEMQKLIRKQYKTSTKNTIDNYINKKLGENVKKSTKTEVFSWDSTTIQEISRQDSLFNTLTLLHGGLIALNPKNGAILTYVGGIDYRTQPYDQIKAKRQLASSFKPIIYASAIENGRKPCDYISNRPFELTDYQGWSPENYDHTSGGKYSLAAALANSKNIPTVRLFFEEGYDNISQLWNKLGFSDSLINEPSISLGTAQSSIYELAQAYSAFVNDGRPVNAYAIESIKTQSGEIIYQHETLKNDQAISNETANYISQVLQKAINEGTGTSLRNRYNVKIPLAGKTGTSQNYADAWFTAFNPNIIIISRVGANSPTIHFNNGKYGSGSTLALPLVAKTLAYAQKDEKLYRLINGSFESSTLIDCEDYLEDSAIEEIFNIFRKKETTLEKEQKRAKRKKNSPFKKIFGN